MATSLKDIKQFYLSSYEDFRGSMFTTYDEHKMDLKFHHHKVCVRYKSVLVGIHGDFKAHKLITCLYGRIYFVAVDARPESSDYLKHKTFILGHENKLQLLLPPGIGTSFLVLSDVCIYDYKLSYSGEYNDYDKQFTLKWNDETLDIHWPIKNPILSERDKNATGTILALNGR